MDKILTYLKSLLRVLCFFLPKEKYTETYERVTVKHGNKTYTIRELSLAERTALVTADTDDKNPLVLSAWLLSLACDEFKNKNTADIANLASPKAIETISRAILDLSSLLPESLEDTEKNFEGGQS